MEYFFLYIGQVQEEKVSVGPQSSTLKPGRSLNNSIIGEISPPTGEFYNWLLPLLE